MKRFNYYKVAAATPPVHIGNPKKNVDGMLEIARGLDADTQLVVFPELAVSGYTCQDLFYEEALLEASQAELLRMAKELPANMACVVGVPLVVEGKLINGAAFLFNGEVLGVYIKSHIPGYNEYYEPRWFTPAREIQTRQITLGNQTVPVGDRILFLDRASKACIGIEICEDLWVAIPVSSNHALAGANVLVNCSASNEVIAKDDYRRELVRHQSAATYSGYVYASAGRDESSSDLVFSGHDLIAENGAILAQTTLYDPQPVLYGEIDLQHLRTDRLHFKTSLEQPALADYRVVEFSSSVPETIELTRRVDAYPFVPSDIDQRIARCHKILTIQACALATRLKKIGCTDVVLGISGGLDSTLALLVVAKAFDMLGYDPSHIHAITMPGFGTTARTKSNADQLMEILGASAREISIVDGVRQHFADIGHDEDTRDITYENSQARYRTMLLMDLANKHNAIVIGTGDLSELALGWCTYNGDHMSMYAINASVPKTLVRYIVESVAIQAQQEGDTALATVLLDICDTPVSPELLPPQQDGTIAQKTEEVLGSYDLHDFFLYHMLRFHESPKKIFALCCLAFPDVSKETIRQAITTFYRRFFTQQFKRNCMPDGVKVGSISFSPRGDWRMPSDADRSLWMAELDQIG